MSRECKKCGNDVVLMAFGRKDNYYMSDGVFYNSRGEYLETMDDVLYGWEFVCRGCGVKSSKASNICK